MRTTELLTPEQERALFAGVSVAAIAKRLGVSKDHVLKLIGAHALAAVNVSLPGRPPRWRINEADFAAFLRERAA